MRRGSTNLLHPQRSTRKAATAIARERNASFWAGVYGAVGIHHQGEIRNPSFVLDKKQTTDEADIQSRPRYLFSPIGRRKIVWDLITGVAILYSLIDVPFQIGFHSTSQQSNTSLDFLVDGVFFLDILFTFNTVYFHKESNVYITDRRKIAKNYCHFWFWIDLVSTIPFDTIADALSSSSLHSNQIASVKLIRIIRLTRLAKLYKMSKSQSFKEMLESFFISPTIISVLTLMFQIFLVAHIISCFWFFITTVQATGVVQPADPSEPFGIRTWVTEFGFQYSDVPTQYIASLYWTFNTLLSVGYGDIHPVNTGERLFALVVMLMGGLMFGTIIAKVKGNYSNSSHLLLDLLVCFRCS